MEPTSCDTFVVMGDLCGGCTIFGKNSDRPNGEVQEVIYEKGHTYPPGTKLQVTYIEIDQAPSTFSVALSKPSWMWGAEMGSNEHGVCVGNEAIWSEVDASEDEQLLGMDLVRLSLERSKTAREAMAVITNLLEKYGQGGPCSDSYSGMFYHNSYIIVDKKEAWVLETIAKMWAAEKITKGYRNISNCLSIGSNIDLMSDGLKDKARELGLWDGSSQFNFRKAFGTEYEDRERFKLGQDLLKDSTKPGSTSFGASDMFRILRTDIIARGTDCDFPSTGSMVSELSSIASDRLDCHWFTATPDPRQSVFKPFCFTANAGMAEETRSPGFEDDPAKVEPRFRKSIDRSHFLYRQHELAAQRKSPENLRRHAIELRNMDKVQRLLSMPKAANCTEIDHMFKDCVDDELNYYNKHIP